MIDLATTNAFTLVDMLILMVAAFATGLALAWKGPERAISAQRRINAVHAGFGGQVSELPQSGGPVDNLFVGLECYTVVGCSHVHTVAEAEECQHGRCPMAIESLLNIHIERIGSD